MRYINEEDIKEIGINWNETIDAIEKTVKCLENKDFAQPIKPYLRYNDKKNRIIAMPAFVGGDINISGIKWIASFPDNIYKNIPRAHSVVVLNKAETGQPVAVINTALLSIIRTASVSGLMLKHYLKYNELKNFKLGIIGWGPIGQYHFDMVSKLFGDRISKVALYDIRNIIDKNEINNIDREKIDVVDKWQDAYQDADVFLTCTVSKSPYIDLQPKKGSLLLNVSLRDYKTDIYEYVNNPIIVDDWEEVCREETDIERLHNEKGLMKEQTKSIIDVVCNNCIKDFSKQGSVMFNPMGMAVFDMAIGSYYLSKSFELNIGQELK